MLSPDDEEMIRYVKKRIYALVFTVFFLNTAFIMYLIAFDNPLTVTGIEFMLSMAALLNLCFFIFAWILAGIIKKIT